MEKALSVQDYFNIFSGQSMPAGGLFYALLNYFPAHLSAEYHSAFLTGILALLLGIL